MKKTTKKTSKQSDKKTSSKKATSQKAKATGPTFEEARQEALGHEGAGRWAEAVEAWARAGEVATSRVDRIKAAGAEAAAKVRADAKATSLDEALADNPTAVANTSSWNSALPETGYVPPAGEGEDEEEEQGEDDEDVDSGEAHAPTATSAPETQQRPATPRTRDPRLPPVGTVIVKCDRHGAERARCTVMGSGVEYNGAHYRSLSAAAMAAAKDLGLGGTTQDGFAFWKLKKPMARAPFKTPIERLGDIWQRYHDRAADAVRIAEGDDARAEVREALAHHLDELGRLAETVASPS